MLALLTACTSLVAQQPPPSTVNPPSYPSAQALDIKKSNGPRGPVQVMTFQTTDSPQQVLTYYKDLLQKDGWHLHPDLQEPGKLYLDWVSGDSGSGAYELTIEAGS